MPSEVKDALNAAGINASSLDRIKLARGVIGKASYVAASAVLALGVVAWALHDPLYLIIDAVLVVILFLAYFAGSLWFAHKHPGTALLEGAELIQWRQLEVTANNPPPIVDRTKDNPPPLIEVREE